MISRSSIAGILLLASGFYVALLSIGSKSKNEKNLVATPMVGGSLKNSRNGPWPNCLGKDKDYCKGLIQLVNEDLSVELIPDGSPVTADFREDRVRIFYDPDTDLVVEPVPHRG